MHKIKTIVIGLLAVCGLALAAAPRAQASQLQFTYTDTSGLNFTFDQSSSPTPTAYSSGDWTMVSVSNWSGNIGPYSSMIWYSASSGGMFDTPDHALVILGNPVYSGTEQNPMFAPTPPNDPYQFEYGSDCHTITGTLTVTDLSAPEPGTLALFAAALGLLGMAVIIRRRRV